MRILLLCEGNAETRDSWSGVSMSVVRSLRAAGHTVVPGDVDLYGPPRWVVGARTFAPRRKRWWVRYHLHRSAFRARSRRAQRRLELLRGEVDVVLQIGATFRVDTGGLPLVLYCDSTIELSRSAIPSGVSEAAFLTGAELDEIREREAAVYGAADLIFTMSDVLRQSFMDVFRIPGERLVTIHCGPNIQVPAERPEPPARRPPTVLFVGRDFQRKGGDLLLRAFSEVRREVPDARLTVVGGEPPGPRPEWLTHLGYQSRDAANGAAVMERVFREASVFCLPTRFEPFGTSFVEAMLYQLPCVGPAAWAVPEIIANGETGLLVPPEDPSALAHALVRVLRDPEGAHRMGARGRALALERFSWTGMAERMSTHMAALGPRQSGPESALRTA
jgi:glycosyltransferase involved in cell wall biosynthesis